MDYNWLIQNSRWAQQWKHQIDNETFFDYLVHKKFVDLESKSDAITIA